MDPEKAGAETFDTTIDFCVIYVLYDLKSEILLL